jgi:hypothetical protein
MNEQQRLSIIGIAIKEAESLPLLPNSYLDTNSNIKIFNDFRMKYITLLTRLFGEEHYYSNELKNLVLCSEFANPNRTGSISESWDVDRANLIDILKNIKSEISDGKKENKNEIHPNSSQRKDLDELVSKNHPIHLLDSNPANMKAIEQKHVFIVHGQNFEMRDAVALTLNKLEINYIILSEQPDKGMTVIEKLEKQFRSWLCNYSSFP